MSCKQIHLFWCVEYPLFCSLLLKHHSEWPIHQFLWWSLLVISVVFLLFMYNVCTNSLPIQSSPLHCSLWKYNNKESWKVKLWKKFKRERKNWIVHTNGKLWHYGIIEWYKSFVRVLFCLVDMLWNHLCSMTPMKHVHFSIKILPWAEK